MLSFIFLLLSFSDVVSGMAYNFIKAEVAYPLNLNNLRADFKTVSNKNNLILYGSHISSKNKTKKNKIEKQRSQKEINKQIRNLRRKQKQLSKKCAKSKKHRYSKAHLRCKLIKLEIENIENKLRRGVSIKKMAILNNKLDKLRISRIRCSESNEPG